ncbi:hypothetical protein [Enterococcus gallinarum]|uniref:hypothetical protein n=1 Tax=Enterococcus gallinarum TaxID=1353 RepID=UPI002433DE41|nr:hypothetical protein [Enterococcus gallinarum]
MAEKAATKKVAKKETTYSKKVLLESDSFKQVERDFLWALLDDKREYSIDEARELLNKKLEGVVK